MNGTRRSHTVRRVLLVVVGLILMQAAVSPGPAGAAGEPGAFNKLGPVNGAVGQPYSVSLSWATSAGPSVLYQYCYDTVNNDACDGPWLFTPSTTAIIGSLSPSTTYYWHVLAINGAGTTYSNASETAFWSFTTGSVPAPGGFNKAGPANGAAGQPLSVSLSWGTSPGTPTPTYEYCYDTTNDNSCSYWTYTASTSAVIGSLSPSTTYYWHVRAFNSQGTTYSNGSATAFWSFTTGSLLAPGAFGKTGPANGAAGQPLSVSLSWGTSPGTPTPTYEYCYDTTNDNSCSYWTYTASTSAVIGSLSPSTTYYWHVRAVNSQGTTYSDGSATTFWNFATAVLPPPGAFNKTGPANGAAGQPLAVTLSWSSASGLTTPPAGRYGYCYDTTNDNSCRLWTTTTSTSAVVGGLSPNTTYYWHVMAINGSGTTYSDGSATAFWRFTTRSSSPTPVTVRFRSVGAYDGWVRESAESSSVGGALNSWAATCQVGDDALDRQFRSILHFNTRSLPDDAVITSAVLEIKSSSLAGSNPFQTHGNLTVDIREGGFNNAIALEFADFQAPASQTAVGVFGTVPAGRWYSSTLTATAYPNVNPRGHTQLRLRFAVDDNDDAGADYLAFLCGNATPLMDRPTLVITYYVP